MFYGWTVHILEHKKEIYCNLLNGMNINSNCFYLAFMWVLLKVLTVSKSHSKNKWLWYV